MPARFAKPARLSLILLVTFLVAVVAFPTFSVGCAQGNPQSDGAPIVDPVATQQPTLPTPTAMPTQEKPKPANPDEALAPVVTSVDPAKATVGSVGPSVVVSGTNFVSRSIVQLDGAPLATSFVSGTELRATIPTSKLTSVGVLRLSVGTSPPGGGASKEVTFEVVNPGARLTSLSPLSVVAGSGATALEYKVRYTVDAFRYYDGNVLTAP